MLDQAYSRRQFLGLAGGLASIVGLGLVGCGGSGASDAADKGSAAAAESVSGEVTYDGASSFQALVEAAAEKFMDANPDVSVSGSGRLCADSGHRKLRLRGALRHLHSHQRHRQSAERAFDGA